MSEARILGRLLSEVAKRCHDSRLPDTYLVFDTETNGTDPYSCKMLQIGLCFVRDGKVLDRMAGEPVDLMVNSKVVAKGEVVVVDENFGIRIVSLVSPEDRIRSLR